jgi:hypothetical protein
MMDRRDWDAERAAIAASAAGREALIAQSFARVTGGALVPPGSDAAAALWSLPAAVVAHGTEPDPLFFYGNRAALALFEFPAAQFVRLPSRLSAEPGNRAARARLMASVIADGFVAGYSGVRISASGKRFRIAGATVWNLVDADGALCGQAAVFDRWTPLTGGSGSAAA